MHKLPPLHPGVLREEFMKPLKLTAYNLAARIDVPRPLSWAEAKQAE